MLKILKSKQEKDQQEREVNAEEVPQTEPEAEKLPPIKLFISADQLNSLNEDDAEREEHAQMYLKSTKKKHIDPSAFSECVETLERSYIKLGNENSQCPHCRREYTNAPTEVKRCLGCSKAFFKAKRPQDGATVLIREEQREILAMQWQNIKKPDMIENINLDELEKQRLQLEMKTKKQHTIYDVHNLLVEKYAQKSLKQGKFRLYTSLIYYSAEYFRYKRAFGKALIHYFYLYFLQINGASNSVVFGDKVSISDRTHEAISALFKMSNTLSTQYEKLFNYAIESLCAFDYENLPFSVDEAYKKLVQGFEQEEKPPAEEVKEEKTKRFGFRR